MVCMAQGTRHKAQDNERKAFIVRHEGNLLLNFNEHHNHIDCELWIHPMANDLEHYSKNLHNKLLFIQHSCRQWERQFSYLFDETGVEFISMSMAGLYFHYHVIVLCGLLRRRAKRCHTLTA